MLTSPSGDPIPADDPRLPRPSQIDQQKAAADELATAAEKMTGRSFGVKVDADARLDALVSLFVPPEGPVRLLFEFRVQENRAKAYLEIIEAAQRVKAQAEAEATRATLLDGVPLGGRLPPVRP